MNKILSEYIENINKSVPDVLFIKTQDYTGYLDIENNNGHRTEGVLDGEVVINFDDEEKKNPNVINAINSIKKGAELVLGEITPSEFSLLIETVLRENPQIMALAIIGFKFLEEIPDGILYLENLIGLEVMECNLKKYPNSCANFD